MVWESPRRSPWQAHRLASTNQNIPDAANQVVADIEAAGGKAIALSADVSNEDDVKAMYAKLFEAYGTIDILVADADLQRDANLVDMTLAQWLQST